MKIKSVTLDEEEVTEALEDYLKKHGLALRVTEVTKYLSYSIDLTLAVEPKEPQQLLLDSQRGVTCNL